MRVFMLLLYFLVGVAQEACKPGEWRGFVPGHGLLCLPCRSGFYCPDGKLMHRCPHGTATWLEGSAQCCAQNATCGLEGYAVGAYCHCQPIGCDGGRSLMERPNERGMVSYQCVSLPMCNPCPAGNWWVQMRGCQCVQRTACTEGQVWKQTDGSYTCVPY